jgi:hypothetical protein
VAVRLVADFWQNCEEYKELINRCFLFILNKFPNPDGEQDAYDTLLMRLYELNVFGKFDPKKLVAKKMGVNKKDVSSISDEACSSERLSEIGIDIDKKFEQFIFNWIKHVLQESYTQRGKQASRFISSGDSFNYLPMSSKDTWGYLKESPFAQTTEEINKLNKHLERKAQNDNVRFYPTTRDSTDYTGSKWDGALEGVEANETHQTIRSQLVGKERRVYDLLLQGVPKKDIAEAMHCSKQNVFIILNKIKEKIVKMGLTEPVAV